MIESLFREGGEVGLPELNQLRERFIFNGGLYKARDGMVEKERQHAEGFLCESRLPELQKERPK